MSRILRCHPPPAQSPGSTPYRGWRSDLGSELLDALKEDLARRVDLLLPRQEQQHVPRGPPAGGGGGVSPSCLRVAGATRGFVGEHRPKLGFGISWFRVCAATMPVITLYYSYDIRGQQMGGKKMDGGTRSEPVSHGSSPVTLEEREFGALGSERGLLGFRVW